MLFIVCFNIFGIESGLQGYHCISILWNKQTESMCAVYRTNNNGFDVGPWYPSDISTRCKCRHRTDVMLHTGSTSGQHRSIAWKIHNYSPWMYSKSIWEITLEYVPVLKCGSKLFDSRKQRDSYGGALVHASYIHQLRVICLNSSATSQKISQANN